MLKYLAGLLLLAGLILNLAGCSPDMKAKEKGPVLYTVTDDYGEKLSFRKRPVRIYANTVSMNEILSALVSHDRIAAVPQGAVDAEQSLVAEELRDVKEVIPDGSGAEAIISLRPDLVFIQGKNSETAAVLRDAGVPVFATKVPNTRKLVEKHILSMAEALEEKEKGLRLVAGMEEKFSFIRHTLKDVPKEERRVILAYSAQGVFGSVHGLFHHICEEAGVINGAAQYNLQYVGHLSREAILVCNPYGRLLPLPGTSMQKGSDTILEEILGDPALRETDALKNHRIFLIKDRYRYAVSQFMADGSLEISKMVYPEYYSRGGA